MFKIELKNAASLLLLALLWGGSCNVMAQDIEGDANHDGRVDVADISYIIGLMANGGQKAGFPETENFTGTGVPAGVQTVDLGLPSGRLWANMNIGAEKPGDFGLYFAWGEIEGKRGYLAEALDKVAKPRRFDWKSYKFNYGNDSWETIEKYQFPDAHTDACWYDERGQFIGDGLYKLEDCDEAVKKNWNEDWRMPNVSDVRELAEYTTQEWYQDPATGNWGCLFTSLNPDYTDQLFIPASGIADDKLIQKRDDVFKFGHGFYWTSTLYEHNSSNAYILDIDYIVDGMDVRGDGLGEGNIAIQSWKGRYLGLTIRPVKDDK